MQPSVTVSFAQSLDGRIATRSGDSQWISGSASLELAQQLRRDHEGILVGIGTILRDDPLLTCRLPGARSPVRFVLDSRLRLPTDSKLAATAREHRTVLFASGPADAARRTALESRGVEVVELPAEESGRVPARAACEWCAAHGVRSLFVEGGARVITSFLAGRLVDRLIVVIAPLLIGEGISAVGELGVHRLDDALRPASRAVRELGGDLVWELELERR